jgi:hypothetical protein
MVGFGAIGLNEALSSRCKQAGHIPTSSGLFKALLFPFLQTAAAIGENGFR